MFYPNQRHRDLLIINFFSVYYVLFIEICMFLQMEKYDSTR